MPSKNNRPTPEGGERHRLANQRRADAAEYSGRYASPDTHVNQDEELLEPWSYLMSFTKGLPHNEFGQLESNGDYEDFVAEINKQDADNFDRVARGIVTEAVDCAERRCARSKRKVLEREINDGAAANDTKTGSNVSTTDCPDPNIRWRGWESPRAGHYFDLQGPDADAVGMPPAPELGSEELIAEMAEVYALALLRDVPFSQIENTDADSCDEASAERIKKILQAMSGLSWFKSDNEAIPMERMLQQRRRRAARRLDPEQKKEGLRAGYDIDDPDDNSPYEATKAFRGSSPASKSGPYVSQYMLLGNRMDDAKGGEITQSAIAYGRQLIDQKIDSFPPGMDFMVHWNSWLDVQNGADFRSDTNHALDSSQRRFITTPRDLAAYVRYDALYQAYLNACLFMLEDDRFSIQQPVKHPYSGKAGPGLPDGMRQGMTPSSESRQAFAQFGGPHILSLVTEVATRCLKAVRRQKFNYHRRARPERIGALLTLAQDDLPLIKEEINEQLGTQVLTDLKRMMLPVNLGPILDLVGEHNADTINHTDGHLDHTAVSDPKWFKHKQTKNLLLPMAFAEGSPMHPSYGAGHATVAGGCITMLKAFFNTTDAAGYSRPWPESLPVVEATSDGQALRKLGASAREGMTISGELNKLAANISIGRNMAGVHYYTDYYESLRMGERVATGILIEQMKHYNEPLEFGFESFDGDFIHLLKNDYDSADPRVHVRNALGHETAFDDWWLRHLTAQMPKGQGQPAVKSNIAAQSAQTGKSAQVSSQATEDSFGDL